MVVASPKATFGLPEASVGLYAAAGGLPRLFNTVGPRQTGQYGMVVPRFVRKALRGELLAAFPKLSKADVDRLLVAQGLAGMARAEQLDPDAMLSLVNAVHEEECAPT